MTRRRNITLAAAAAVAASTPFLASPPSARAFNPIKPICTVAGLVNGIAQKACSVVSQVAGGTASTATTALTVAAVVTWAVGGAKFLLRETSHVLAKTTAPQLTTTWFSSTYWRVAGIAAVLTLPFLFAAAVQALIRSDLTLLVRTALGYLPLALLATAIAAPVTMLLLAASDQVSAIVSSAAGSQSVHFLDRAAGEMGSNGMFGSASFVAFLVALLTAAGAIVLWLELLVREAAVYVIVLMLPLAFAAFVWPARRIWAVRSLELLVALVLSKFAIVAVLSLGGAAVVQSANRSVTGLLSGAALLSLAAFAPWAMLRIVPLTEIASGAAASLRGGAHAALQGLQRADAWASEGDHWASTTAQMRRTAETSNARAPDPPTSANGASATDGATAAKERLEANRDENHAAATASGESHTAATAESERHAAATAGSDLDPGDDPPPPPGRPTATSEAADSHAPSANGIGVENDEPAIHATSREASREGANARDSVLDLERQPVDDLGHLPPLERHDLEHHDPAEPAIPAPPPRSDGEAEA